MYASYVAYALAEVIFGDMVYVVGQLLQGILPSDKIQVVKARVEKAQKDDILKAPQQHHIRSHDSHPVSS